VDLCVSVVKVRSGSDLHHRDTESTEAAQRDLTIRIRKFPLLATPLRDIRGRLFPHVVRQARP